jgi:hypothetical protein
MPDNTVREHFYHAEAVALSDGLQLPVTLEIEPQAFVRLSEKGGYLTQRSSGFQLESILGFKAAYTQVAGNREVKPGHGWSTLVTAVVEGLNVLDVVTADRVVGQISTEYPLEGYVPSITFLGTRFENLRIAGHKVDLNLDLDICGEKPEGDAPYTRSPQFVNRVSEQHERIRRAQSEHNFLSDLLKRYNRVPESFDTGGDEENVECSLVNQAEGSYPGRTFGHVIHVPHFGTVSLGVLRLTQSDYVPETRTPKTTLFELTMIDIKMGCIATGSASVATMKTNGTTRP